MLPSKNVHVAFTPSFIMLLGWQADSNNSNMMLLPHFVMDFGSWCLFVSKCPMWRLCLQGELSVGDNLSRCVDLFVLGTAFIGLFGFVSSQKMLARFTTHLLSTTLHFSLFVAQNFGIAIGFQATWWLPSSVVISVVCRCPGAATRRPP